MHFWTLFSPTSHLLFQWISCDSSRNLTLHWLFGGCRYFCIFSSWCPKLALIQVQYLLYTVWSKKSSKRTFFGWCQHFSWWRHQFFVNFSWNRVSYSRNDNFWTKSRKKEFDPSYESCYIAAFSNICFMQSQWIFCADVSSFSAHSGTKMAKWRHVTSRDVNMSDFHQTFRKCFSYWYEVTVQIWSDLHYLNKSYDNFCILPFCMEIYRKTLPIRDKKPISSLLRVANTPNFQEMCQIELN